MGQFSLHAGEMRGMRDSRLHTSFPGFSFLLPGMSLCRDELERTLKTRLKRLERVLQYSFFLPLYQIAWPLIANNQV